MKKTLKRYGKASFISSGLAWRQVINTTDSKTKGRIQHVIGFNVPDNGKIEVIVRSKK